MLQLTTRNIVALQVEKRCCTHYHPPQTLSRNKISLLQVEAACCSKLNWRLIFFNKFFQLATTKFCCETMFEVGGNRGVATGGDLQRKSKRTQVEEKSCPIIVGWKILYYINKFYGTPKFYCTPHDFVIMQIKSLSAKYYHNYSNYY